MTTQAYAMVLLVSSLMFVRTLHLLRHPPHGDRNLKLHSSHCLEQFAHPLQLALAQYRLLLKYKHQED